VECGMWNAPVEKFGPLGGRHLKEVRMTLKSPPHKSMYK